PAQPPDLFAGGWCQRRAGQGDVEQRRGLPRREVWPHRDPAPAQGRHLTVGGGAAPPGRRAVGEPFGPHLPHPVLGHALRVADIPPSPEQSRAASRRQDGHRPGVGLLLRRITTWPWSPPESTWKPSPGDQFRSLSANRSTASPTTWPPVTYSGRSRSSRSAT